ncbi:MAG: GntR family transcriptional regulator [Bacteroidota bacterium]
MLASGKPRHEQISNWIRERIDGGVYAPNDQLLSENQICEQFGVSRITVRRALQTLESEGLIFRRQGLGAFVADNRVSQDMVRLTSFVEDMQQAGLAATSVIVSHDTVPCPDAIAEKLNLSSGKKVVVLERLRLGNGEPIAFDRTWLPAFYGQLLEGSDLENETIYRVLEEDYEIEVLRGHYRLGAVNADRFLAEQLHVREGLALFLIERTSMTTHDKPVYFQRRYYRTDKVSYELELVRDGEKGKHNSMPLREFAPKFNQGS